MDKCKNDFLICIQYLRNKNYKKALELLKIKESVLPKNKIYISICYLEMNLEMEAIEYIENNINSVKDSLIIRILYYILSEIYLKKKNAVKSFEYYNKSLSLGTKFYNDLGQIYYNIDIFDKAIHYFSKAIKNNEYEAFHNINILVLKNYDLALQYYLESISKGFEDSIIGIANCYAFKCEFKKAFNYYFILLKKKRNNIDINKKIIGTLYNFMGNCQYKLGDKKFACNLYLYALKYGFNSSYPKILKLYMELNYYDKAIKFIFSSSKYGYPIHYRYLGNCYLHNNNLEKAKKYYEFGLNNNCLIIKKELSSFISVDKNNAYTVDIDSLYAIMSLTKLGNNKQIDNTNKRKIEYEFSEYFDEEIEKKKNKYF